MDFSKQNIPNINMSSLLYLYDLALEQAKSPYDFFTRLASFFADRTVFVPNIIAYIPMDANIAYTVLTEEESLETMLNVALLRRSSLAEKIWNKLSQDERRELVDDPEIIGRTWKELDGNRLLGMSPFSSFRDRLVQLILNLIKERREDIILIVWNELVQDFREDPSLSIRMLSRIYNIIPSEQREQLIQKAWDNFILSRDTGIYIPYIIQNNPVFDGVLGDFTQLVYETAPFVYRDKIKEIWIERYGDLYRLFVYLRTVSGDSTFITNFHQLGELDEYNSSKYQNITIPITVPVDETNTFISELEAWSRRFISTIDISWNLPNTVNSLVHPTDIIRYRDEYNIGDGQLASTINALYQRFSL
jgi:hypothetical protein